MSSGRCYFTIKLAKRGYPYAIGIDALAVNIHDADLMRRSCKLDNFTNPRWTP